MTVACRIASKRKMVRYLLEIKLRVYLAILCLIVTCSALAQDSFQGKLYDGKNFVGTAEFGLRAMKDGTFQGHIEIKHGHDVRTSSYVCDMTGRVTFEQVDVKGPTPGSKTMSFGPKSVKVFSLDGKRARQFDIPYPHDAILTAQCRLWFIRVHPQVGTICRYTVFDPGLLVWEQVEDHYIGDEKITYNGKPATAHKVKTGDGTEWLDDHGVLYKRTGKTSELVRDGVAP